VHVRVKVNDMGLEERLPNLELTIWGQNLHAPMIERIVELPMDIYGGEWIWLPTSFHDFLSRHDEAQTA
jgi:hypothetical protein